MGGGSGVMDGAMVREGAPFVGAGMARPFPGSAFPLGRSVARLLSLPPDPSQVRLRAIRDGLLIAGLIVTAFVLVVIPTAGHSLGYDAYAYWSIDPSALYDRTLQGQYALGGFRYAPPIGLIGALLHQLPWWLFLWLWIALMVAAVAFLGGRWTLALLALPPVALEIEQGNVHLLMAVAIVAGFRWPWTWSFVLLTKVTPGIGLLWFAVRREWRSLAIALGFTAAVCAVSYAVAPGLWPQWLNALTVNASQTQDFSIPPPLPLRLPAAALLVIWGARTDRPWTVGVAAMLALPILWVHGLCVGLAAVPFLRRRADARRTADPAGSRRRFVSIRDLFGRDPEGSRSDAAPSPWITVASLAGFAALALALALVAEPVLREVLRAASEYLTPPAT